MKNRVLIIEDDASIGLALKEAFSFEGYEVEIIREGGKALRLIERQKWDLILLDIMLPEKNGLDICKEIRSQGNAIPIIMLTARGQEVDKVVGLKMGADDYVTKPFSFAELLARVEAILRRTERENGNLKQYRFGSIEIDFGNRIATKEGQEIELSSREFDILRYFVETRGKVVSREKILVDLWGYNSPLTRTVDMHVAKLRRKIEDSPDNPQYIITVHRYGYRFCG